MAKQALEVFLEYLTSDYAEFPSQIIKKEDIEGAEFDSILLQVPQSEEEEDDVKFVNVIFFPKDEETFPFLQLVQFYYPVLDNISEDLPPAVSQYMNYLNGILPLGSFVRYDNTLVLRQITTLPAEDVEPNVDMLGNVLQFVIAFGQMYLSIIKDLFAGKISFEEALTLSENEQS